MEVRQHPEVEYLYSECRQSSQYQLRISLHKAKKRFLDNFYATSQNSGLSLSLLLKPIKKRVFLTVLVYIHIGDCGEY